MASKNNGNGKLKQRRGFALMTLAQRQRICRMGGKATSRRYGRKHMSRIGKIGRTHRTRNERRAAKAAQ